MRKGEIRKSGEREEGYSKWGRRTVGSWLAGRWIVRFGNERAAVIVGEELAITAEM